MRFDGAAAEGGAERVAVVVPKGNSNTKYPVLIALHGRGEAGRGAEVGAYAWLREYGLGDTIARLRSGHLDDLAFGGFVGPKRLEAINRSLAERPYQGLVIVCPHTPDILSKPRTLDGADRFATWLGEKLLPRVATEFPVTGDVGIDGVSLGGRVALLAGFARPKELRAVGSLQAAIDASEAEGITARAKTYVAARPDGKIRLLTSDGDPFAPAIAALDEAMKKASVPHEHVVVVGPHNYAFNQGPGGIEMLLFHDRVLRGAASL